MTFGLWRTPQSSAPHFILEGSDDIHKSESSWGICRRGLQCALWPSALKLSRLRNQKLNLLLGETLHPKAQHVLSLPVRCPRCLGSSTSEGCVSGEGGRGHVRRKPIYRTAHIPRPLLSRLLEFAAFMLFVASLLSLHLY